MTIKIAFLILALAQIADGISTAIALRFAGLAEGNPVAARLFGIIGPVAGCVLLKGLCIALGGYVALGSTLPDWAKAVTLWFGIAVTGWVSIDNFGLVKKQWGRP